MRVYSPRLAARRHQISCCGAARWCYSVISLLFAIACFAVFLYVFPPWKIKAVAEAVWQAGSSAASVVSKVALEEEKAQKFLAQAAKSGREMWASVQDEAQNTISKLKEPVLEVL